jgi:hypothetical protein
VEGMDIIEVATLRDAIEAGLSPRSERRGDALPAMLG